MFKKRLSIICLLLVSACLSCPGRAETNDDTENDCPGPAIAVQKNEASVFHFLDAPQKNISTGLEWLSKRIDVFFANENIYNESTGSYARLSATTIFRDGGKKSFLGDLNVRVELPHTQKKLNLIIETDEIGRASCRERV